MIGGNGQNGLIATVGGKFAATAYVQGFMRRQPMNGSEVFNDGTMELDLEASAGGEWRGDHWLVRWTRCAGEPTVGSRRQYVDIDLCTN